MSNLFFAFPGNEALTNSLVNKLGGELGSFTLRSFPDEETYIRFTSNVENKTCIIVCSLDKPDPKIIQLYFISRLCKDLKALKVVLIAPYLSYMRQDKIFKAGEAVTSEYFAQLISQWFDALITIDPHLHRKHSMAELYSIPCTVIHAAQEIAEWLFNNVQKPVLIGPDIESQQWVTDVAKKLNAPFITLLKSRISDNEVQVTVPHVEKFMEYTPVLIDDIISTGQTMIETISHLKNAGMKPVTVIAVHGIFAGNAYEDLIAAGAGQIVTCNTVKHPSNKIDLAPLFDLNNL